MTQKTGILVDPFKFAMQDLHISAITNAAGNRPGQHTVIPNFRYGQIYNL